jgi:hypothetical protein
MDTFFMDTVFDSTLAILAIVVPLGMAYIILSLQARKHQGENRKGGNSIESERRTQESNSRNPPANRES